MAIAVTVVVIIGRWRKKIKKRTRNYSGVPGLSMPPISLTMLPPDRKPLRPVCDSVNSSQNLDVANASFDADANNDSDVAQLSTSPAEQESVIPSEVNASGPANQL